MMANSVEEDRRVTALHEARAYHAARSASVNVEAPATHVVATARVFETYLKGQ